jgi:hypothetical protein
VANPWYIKLLKDFTAGVKAGAVQDQDVGRLRPAAAETYRALKMALFVTDDEPIVSMLNEIEVSVLAAMNVVDTGDASTEGVARTARELRRLRAGMARKGVDVVTIAQRAIARRKASLVDPQTGSG